MRRLDLPPKLVQSFLAVLRMQSYTKAAQALNLTQPAVTQHVARLEDILGVSLIERRRGVVLPTEHAQVLLPDLERFERSVGLIFEKARAVAQSGQHTIQIATTTSMVATILAPAINSLKETGTDVFPIFKEVDDYRVYDMVRAGEVDFALTSMTGSDAELACTFLFQDRSCLVFPEGHALSGEGAVPVEDIVSYPLIRPPRGTAANHMIELIEKAYSVDFTFAAEASRIMTMEVLVRARLGLLILPALSAEVIAGAGLAFRPIATSIGARHSQLVHPIRKRQTALDALISRKVVETVDALVRRRPGLVSRNATPMPW